MKAAKKNLKAMKERMRVAKDKEKAALEESTRIIAKLLSTWEMPESMEDRAAMEKAPAKVCYQ